MSLDERVTSALPRGTIRPHVGERRRRYAVTVLADEDETIEQVDRRVCEQLGLVAGKTKVTVAVYEPATDDFRNLNEKRRT